MRKIYYDEYIDSNDEISDEEMMNELDPENHEIILDDPEIDDATEEEMDILVPVKPRTLLAALKDELKLKEYERGSLVFTKDGIEYEGVPMLAINDNKFVFKLLPDGKMKSFHLSDMQVVA